MIRQVALIVVVVVACAQAQLAADTLAAGGLGGAGYLGGVGVNPALNTGYGAFGLQIQNILAQLSALGPHGRVLANQLITQNGLYGLGAGNGLLGGTAAAGGLLPGARGLVGGGLYKK